MMQLVTKVIQDIWFN